MAINADKPHLWKADAEQSIDFYNDWFLRFAPDTFRTERAKTTGQVADALKTTDYLRNLHPENLMANPGILPMLRMACAPPLARDRLIGLAHLNKNLVLSMEGKADKPPRMPPRMPRTEQLEQLQRIRDTLIELADRELFTWLESGDEPTEEQITRSSMVVADRLCGAASDPIIRNAQERRQLKSIENWLKSRGYQNERGPQEVQIAEEPALYATHSELKEMQRFARQKEVDARRTQSERNKMGQFSTPFLLAEDIIKYSLSLAAANNQRISFLEPALGSGVFFSALESCALHNQIDNATGVELDAEYARVASNLWPERPFEVENFDFLDFSTLPDRQKTYTLLCTNPPYVRHHHLLSHRKLELQQRIMQELQLRPSGLSGLHLYFILLAHGLLREGGIASWLVPSEFLSVNYGRVLREYLLRRVTLRRIHQFDPTDVQFDDALVSSCVVTYEKKEPSGPYEFQFSYGGTLNEPREVRTISSIAISPAEKWSFSGTDSNVSDERESVRLGDIFDIKRGIATGANGFFIVDQETIAKYNIPNQFLRPILPSPRYVKDLVIRTGGNGFPEVPGARHLIDCNLPSDQVKMQFPNFWRYLELGESKGVPDGYLCASRKIWYQQEQREPALYMATYMSRSRSRSANPFRFFLNLSDAIGANVYLLLYPKPGLKEALDGREDRMLQLLDMLNGLTREQVISKGRTYGGGLHKLEPKELATLQLSDAPEWLQVQTQMQFAFA